MGIKVLNQFGDKRDFSLSLPEAAGEQIKGEWRKQWLCGRKSAKIENSAFGKTGGLNE